jgi:hypothetical protein
MVAPNDEILDIGCGYYIMRYKWPGVEARKSGNIVRTMSEIVDY